MQTQRRAEESPLEKTFGSAKRPGSEVYKQNFNIVRKVSLVCTFGYGDGKCFCNFVNLFWGKRMPSYF